MPSFAIESVFLVHALVDPPIEFRRNKITAAPPAQLLERRAHHFLRLAARVHFRIIEEIYPGIMRGGHHLQRGFYIGLIVKCHPRPKR
jgi:hypothetical protein